MMLFLCLLWVPLALLAWRLCAVGGEADDEMEIAFQKMMQEREQSRSQDGDGFALGKEEMNGS